MGGGKKWKVKVIISSKRFFKGVSNSALSLRNDWQPVKYDRKPLFPLRFFKVYLNMKKYKPVIYL